MSFSLSFSPEFYGDVYNPIQEHRPTTVANALLKIPHREWEELAREVFDLDNGEYLGIDDVIQKIMETDTCTDLSSPVEVWIDSDGFFKVLVYDSGESS